ncbi:MAG: hypothetical protein EU541_00915 [Promethearchaeota archaeon]|nr:MAG: hypothetical protein EU541_00915 [Candidatus Lokiarchaeota archaeon]
MSASNEELNDKERIEEFAKQYMEKRELRGKSRRMKIMRIIETVGFDERKIETALQRATINKRIEHE